MWSIFDMFKTNQIQWILIGIGRPDSRDPDIVSDYVLSGFEEKDKNTLFDVVFPEIVKVLTKDLN